MDNTQGQESGGSWFETCSGVWYPKRRPCGVAINTLVDLINRLGKLHVWRVQIIRILLLLRCRGLKDAYAHDNPGCYCSHWGGNLSGRRPISLDS